jgi:hypothetical protein
MKHAAFECFSVRCLRLIGVVAGLFLLAFLGATVCSGTQIKEKANDQLQPTTMPEAICVTDFAIDIAAVKEDSGPLGGVLKGGPIQRLNPLHRQETPETKAREMVNLLSDSLSQDLRNQQLPAKRIYPGQSVPGKGWVITGQFLEVDEGNRLRRAIIGFGAGETEMQIEVKVTDVGRHPGNPFLILGSTTGSGKMPGAVVTMNPYVAAAKFVLAKNASEKDVVRTASGIASEIVTYMKAHGLLK